MKGLDNLRAVEALGAQRAFLIGHVSHSPRSMDRKAKEFSVFRIGKAGFKAPVVSDVR
jgi:hypothetical protein